MTTKGLKLIGKGLFSKVYQLNNKEVLIHSDDYAKECLANYIESKLLPPIQGLTENFTKWNITQR